MEPMRGEITSFSGETHIDWLETDGRIFVTPRFPRSYWNPVFRGFAITARVLDGVTHLRGMENIFKFVM